MIREVKTIVPATPEKIVVSHKTICDDCGAEGAFNECGECGADLCVKCRKYHPTSNDGDYTTWICSSCRDVLAAHEVHIEKLEKQVENAYTARTLNCRNKRDKLYETNKS